MTIYARWEVDHLSYIDYLTSALSGYVRLSNGIYIDSSNWITTLVLYAVRVGEPGAAIGGLGVSAGPPKTATVRIEGLGWQRTAGTVLSLWLMGMVGGDWKARGQEMGLAFDTPFRSGRTERRLRCSRDWSSLSVKYRVWSLRTLRFPRHNFRHFGREKRKSKMSLFLFR
jgi:hypothetical protein